MNENAKSPMWRFLIRLLPPHIRAEHAEEVEDHLKWLSETQRVRMGAIRFWLFVWGDFLRVAVGRKAFWPVSVITSVGLLAALTLSHRTAEEAIDVEPALAQVQEVLGILARAEDPADLAGLSQQVGQTLRDSVVLVVTPAENGGGWAAVGTHVRLGQSLGCAFTSRPQLVVSTPRGLVHDGSGQILCDHGSPDG